MKIEIPDISIGWWMVIIGMGMMLAAAIWRRAQPRAVPPDPYEVEHEEIERARHGWTPDRGPLPDVERGPR